MGGFTIGSIGSFATREEGEGEGEGEGGLSTATLEVATSVGEGLAEVMSVGTADSDSDDTSTITHTYGMHYTFSQPASHRNKSLSFINLNMLSGSNEILRQSLGGYFYNIKDSSGHFQTPPPFYKFIQYSNPNPNVHRVRNFFGKSKVRVSDTVVYDFTIDAIQDQRSIVDTLVPFNTFVVQIESDPSQEYLSDPVKGSKYWRTLFTGEQFDGTASPKIYEDGVYQDHYFRTTLPYPKIQEQFLKNSAMLEYVQLGYQYNHLYREYQALASSIDSELALPNIYTFIYGQRQQATVIDQNNPNSSLLYENGTDFYEYYTMERRISPGKYFNYPIKQYLNEMFPVSSSKVSPTIVNNTTRKIQNILSLQAHDLLTTESLNAVASNFPYYNRITFTPESAAAGTGDWKTRAKSLHPIALNIKENNYDALFLRTLKEIFLGETRDSLPLGISTYLQNERFEVPSINPDADEIYSTSTVKQFRSINLAEMILYSHNKIKCENDNFVLLDHYATGEGSDEHILKSAATYDDKGVYRAYNSKNSIKTLNFLLNSMRLSGDSSAIGTDTLWELLNSYSQDLRMDYFEWMHLMTDFSNPEKSDPLSFISPDDKKCEILAYRIEKIGGPADGDSNTQNVLQNYWIFNDPFKSNVDIIDTQVKYDKDYTYRIYAYYCVSGVKYKYHNLQISRIIGAIREDSLDPESKITAYCIEYYDPKTGETVEDYVRRDQYGAFDEIESAFLTSESRRLAIGATSAGHGDPHPPFYANFLTTIQPEFKVIEIPLYSKTYRILDNPPNEINVVPNYALDNSSKLMFDIYYQSYVADSYPKAVTGKDSVTKSHYLKANDMLTTTILAESQETVSPADKIQVFKLDYKPTSFKDFEGSEYAMISMKRDGSYDPYTTAIFEDVVSSNVKHYYLFRAVNELNIAGNTDVVIEAELINDGGYKYALFNTLFEQDLIKEFFVEKYENCKNLIELRPNLSQTIINTENVDYTQTAKSQYNKVTFGDKFNIENIWGETFKIRLTSKKTGKKIDLNVTYNDPNSISMD